MSWGKYPPVYETTKQLAMMRQGLIPVRLGLIGTSLEAGTSGNRWFSYLYAQLQGSGYIVQETKIAGTGGAVLDAIGTTQLDSVLDAGCNLVIIGGPVNDYAATADSTATAKSTAITILGKIIAIWETCLARGVVPVQLAGSATDSAHYKGVLHLNRLMRRAADRMGVPFVDGCYTVSVDAPDGAAFTGFTTDGTHFDREACPVYAKVVGDFLNGINPYSIYLNHGVHDYDNEFSSLSIINTHAFVDSGGSASTTNTTLGNSGTVLTYSTSAADGVVAKGFWVNMARISTGNTDCYATSPGNLVQAGDEILSIMRVKMADMSGSRSSFTIRTQHTAFNASLDEPSSLCEIDFADPGFIAVNLHPVDNANGTVRVSAKSNDYGSGTSDGTISIAMVAAINLTAIDRDLDDAGFNLPAIA